MTRAGSAVRTVAASASCAAPEIAPTQLQDGAARADEPGMAMKLMNLRVDETCAACYGRTPMETMAWWDGSRSQVICTRCRPVEFEPLDMTRSATVEAPARSLTVAVASAAAGSAATASFGSSVDDGASGDDACGPDAGAAADTAERRHVDAWEGRAKEERRLTTFLDDIAVGHAVVLHHRRLPDSKVVIDHLVIAPNGVWVIDGTEFSARIGYRSTDWVRPHADRGRGGRRQQRLVDGMAARCDAVRELIEPIGMGAVPVRAAVCFTHSHWPARDHVETVHEVIVAPPIALGAVLLQPGWVDADAINTIATQLTAGLPVHSR